MVNPSGHGGGTPATNLCDKVTGFAWLRTHSALPLAEARPCICLLSAVVPHLPGYEHDALPPSGSTCSTHLLASLPFLHPCVCAASAVPECHHQRPSTPHGVFYPVPRCHVSGAFILRPGATLCDEFGMVAAASTGINTTFKVLPCATPTAKASIHRNSAQSILHEPKTWEFLNVVGSKLAVTLSRDAVRPDYM